MSFFPVRHLPARHSSHPGQVSFRWLSDKEGAFELNESTVFRRPPGWSTPFVATGGKHGSSVSITFSIAMQEKSNLALSLHAYRQDERARMLWT